MANKKKIAAAIASVALAGGIGFAALSTTEAPTPDPTPIVEKSISQQECETQKDMVWIKGWGVHGCFTKKN